MRVVLDIALDDTTPAVAVVLAAQGIPSASAASGQPNPAYDPARRARSRQLAQQAISLYQEQAAPRGLFDELLALRRAASPVHAHAFAAIEGATRDGPTRSGAHGGVLVGTADPWLGVVDAAGVREGCARYAYSGWF